MADHDAFIRAMLPTARKYEQLYGIPAEAFVAINISETGWGNAGSYFGIKGTGSAGGIDYTTWENYGAGAEHTVITDQFAAYKSLDDAYAAFIDFLTHNPAYNRYTPAWTAFQQTHDWQGLIRGIRDAGYATDPGWPNLIFTLADQVRASAPFKETTVAVPTPTLTLKQGIEKGNDGFLYLWHDGVAIRRYGSTEHAPGFDAYTPALFAGREAWNLGGKFYWLRSTDDAGKMVPLYLSEKEGE